MNDPGPNVRSQIAEAVAESTTLLVLTQLQKSSIDVDNLDKDEMAYLLNLIRQEGDNIMPKAIARSKKVRVLRDAKRVALALCETAAKEACRRFLAGRGTKQGPA